MSALLEPETSEVLRGAVARENMESVPRRNNVDAWRPRSTKTRVGSDLPPTIDVSYDTSDNVPPKFDLPPLFRVTSASPPLPRRIRVLQQFEGVVTEVGTTEFTAELRDLTDSRRPPEVADFPYAEISASDRSLVEPGAVFYWAIGYDTSPGGQTTRISEIRLRRAPVWTDRKLEVIAREADEWYQRVIKDGEQGPSKS
jgi:hypothetical protein